MRHKTESTTLPIAFKPEDRDLIQKAAKVSRLAESTWIRQTALLAAEELLEGAKRKADDE